MKKNAVPELSAKWWSSNEPDGLSSSANLAKALGDYESASASLKKDGGEDDINDCLEALTQIESAARKLQGEAEKLVKSPPKKTTSTAEDYQNTADALKKYPKIVEAARKEKEKEKEALAKSAAEDEEGEGEDQEPEGLLKDEPQYRKYLLGAMKKLLRAPMGFAFGLGSKPEEHRFICHKSKNGKALFKTLKDETDLTKATFGTARAHELEAGVLTLALEGKQIGALKKKGELFLKYFKPLPFHTIMLMVDGEIVEDIPDLDDVPPPPSPPPPPPPPADPLSAKILATLITLLKQAEPLVPKIGGQLKTLAEQVRKQVRDGQSREAGESLKQIAELIKRTNEEALSGDRKNEFMARVGELKSGLDRVKSDPAEEAKLRASEAGALLRQAVGDAQKGRWDDAFSSLAQAEALCAKPTKQAVPETPPEPAKTNSSSTESETLLAESLKAWTAERATAVAQLDKLSNAIKATNEPEADGLIILLNAIIKNLTPLPTTLKQVNELVRYLETDDIMIDAESPNPFGFTVSVRTPLLNVLADLAKYVA